MTIDLGYAWRELPSGEELAFVDVPGHERFATNMLAGVGPVPAVLLVVAADGGWAAQTEEHVRALDALGVSNGLIAVTRSDLADPGLAMREAESRLIGTSLEGTPALAVSGANGLGLPALCEALDELVARLPAPDPGDRIRFWIDRSFTMHGSGTIVTGTLGSGTLHRGDVLLLRDRPVTVRALQSQGRPVEQISGTARVAINLRGIARKEARRGDSLLTEGAWLPTTIVDVRTSATELPKQIVAHIGSAAVPATVRPLSRGYDGGYRVVRLTLAGRLPLKVGDRLLLRDPGRRLILGGASVLDPAPPPLRRRGAARARASELDGDTGVPNLESELSRRGVASLALLQAIGVATPESLPKSARVAGSWMIHRNAWDEWLRRLDKRLGTPARGMLVDSGVGRDELVRTLELPDSRLLTLLLASRPDLEEVQGRVRPLGQTVALRPDVEAAVDELITDLHRHPFSAPDQPALADRGLGPHELGAAAATGRVLLLPGLVVLLPSAPAEAVDRLLRLEQPFTLSGARQALGTTRRVAVPLLEYLDGLRLTERVGTDLRQVRSHGAKTPVRQ